MIGILIDDAGVGFDEMLGTVERAKVTDLPSAPFGRGGSVETVARREGYHIHELSVGLGLLVIANREKLPNFLVCCL